MTKGEARQAAEAARGKYDIPPEGRLHTVEKKYIELAGEDPMQPGPVRDVLVWLARFRIGLGSVELALDDRSGQVVRVQKSRGSSFDPRTMTQGV